MKAAKQDRYGPPEVMKIQEVPKPKPNGKEVLIKVHATTVNRTDQGFRAAKPWIVRLFAGLLKPRRGILGNEFAGVVEEVGAAVTEFKKGDKVFGFNDVTFGAHAEYMVTPADRSITTMPKNFSFKQAAPMAEGAQYALNDIRAAKVKSGDAVLVYGASGAIGSAAVQVLVAMGAEVTAVCGTKNVVAVKTLGAHEIVDYQKQEFTSTDKRYDFIFDAVGKTSYGACKQLLKNEGVFCSTELGPWGQNPILALSTKLTRKKVIFPLPRANKEKVEYLRDLAEQGQYVPLIDRTYKFEDIVEAAEYVDTGEKIGNVVIIIRPN